MGGMFMRILRAACSTILAAIGSLGLAALPALAADLVIPLATWGSPTHVNIINFVGPLEQALQKRSNGRISLKHYPAGQLAEDVDMPIAIPTGKVKFGWVTPAGWSGLIPDVKVLDAPFGLTMEQAATAEDAPGGIREVLDKQFRAKGATLLAVTDIGPTAFVSNRKVVAPKDFEGLKVRVYSEGGMEMMSHLGAAPTKLAFAEVYTAMQRGTIDAAMIGYQGIASQRMYEVAKFALVPASFFGTGSQGWVANLRWWEGLPADDRKIVAEAIREAELICRAELIKGRETLREEYRAKGMDVVILDPSMPEFAKWSESMSPFLEKAKKDLSKEIVAAVEKVRGGPAK